MCAQEEATAALPQATKSLASGAIIHTTMGTRTKSPTTSLAYNPP